MPSLRMVVVVVMSVLAVSVFSSRSGVKLRDPEALRLSLGVIELCLSIVHMGVSINGGTQQWMVFKGKSQYNG